MWAECWRRGAKEMGVGGKPGDFTFIYWRAHLWAPSESDDVIQRDVWTHLTLRLQPFTLRLHEIVK